MTWTVSHVAALLLAVSYLMLGVIDADTASELWAPYAVLTLVAAVLNIVMERRRHDRHA